MKWHPFHQLTVQDFVSKRLAKELAGLNSEIDNLIASRTSLDAEKEKAQSANVETLDFDNLVAIPTHRAAIAMLLQTELGLRRRFDDLEASFHVELQEAVTAASEAHGVAQREVTEGLVALGYVDAPLTHGIRGSIPPGFLQIHPRVIEALERSHELSAQSQSRELKAANLHALAAIEEELITLRDAAVAL